jgi:sugar lactone lactonase YvrE
MMRKRLSVLAVMVLCGVIAQEPSGVITTAVGNGKEAPVGGVGGSATTTPLHYPLRVAVDTAGLLYFIDRAAADRDNAVWKVSSTGALTRLTDTNIWGDGLALDASGNAYVSDESRHVVYKVTPAGVTTVVAGTLGQPGFSGDGGPATSARLNSPRGLAVDYLYNLYIADSGNNRIRMVPSGGAPGILIITLVGSGSAGYSGDGGPASSAQLSGPKGLAVDASQTLYIADTNNHRIRKVTRAGQTFTISTMAGLGVGAGTEQFEEPVDVALDGAGNLFVADRFANKIRKVTSAGAVSTVAGTGTRGYSGDGGPATAAQLNLPGGVAVDGANNLYIADSFNFRIRKVALPISPGGPLVIVTSSPLPTGTVGVAYSTTLVGGGGTPSYRWSLSAGSLPSGLSLASTTGVLSGTPTAPGTFSFTVRVTDSAQPAASATKAFTMTVEPPVTSGPRFTGLADSVAPATQPVFGLTLDQSYPLEVTGQITLSFAADAVVPADDAAVQFVASASRTLNFRILANATQAEFPQGSPAIQTGTTAGVITLRVTSMTAGGVNILPSAAPSKEVRLSRQPPVISSARFVLVSGGFQVIVVGYSTSREVTRATFNFTSASSGNLQTRALTPDVVASRFAEWYRSAASAENGSRFTLTANFNVQGDVNAVAGATVTLTNAQGDSASASAPR